MHKSFLRCKFIGPLTDINTVNCSGVVFLESLGTQISDLGGWVIENSQATGNSGNGWKVDQPSQERQPRKGEYRRHLLNKTKLPSNIRKASSLEPLFKSDVHIC